MGWFDDMVGKARRRAREELADYAVRQAKTRARRTVERVRDDLFGRSEAEREREEAERRQAAEAEAKARVAAEIEARRKAREEREQRAREDVERLKREAHAKRR